MSFEVVRMQPGNRMVRIGCGRHAWCWFVRVDLWWVGLRLTR